MKTFRNIVIAEDDQDDFCFLSDALHEINSEFIIRQATNGLQVMGYLKAAEVPDIIFLDLNMPIRNGIATLQLIKAIPGFRNIPIVIYTTSTYNKAIDDAYNNEAHYFIVKPVSQIVLYNQLLYVFNLLLNNKKRPAKEHFVIDLKEEKKEGLS